ncbi:unnamed protein product [Phytophthora fragariaefolia]|uniref:Unnamed protein product n=1 Tax=Phytophthora fragariaefolia TaxID=1490495 RepID=A0A9W6WZ29_9STRA|nr:unnamed protein product [Phytophthora fragariaefolia]
MEVINRLGQNSYDCHAPNHDPNALRQQSRVCRGNHTWEYPQDSGRCCQVGRCKGDRPAHRGVVRDDREREEQVEKADGLAGHARVIEGSERGHNEGHDAELERPRDDTLCVVLQHLQPQRRHAAANARRRQEDEENLDAVRRLILVVDGEVDARDVREAKDKLPSRHKRQQIPPHRGEFSGI